MGKMRNPNLWKYHWKPGQSGNPKGRPKGKTLKEFAREYILSLPDEQKLKHLATVAFDDVWKMAEGNPDNKTVAEITHTLSPEAKEKAKKAVSEFLSNKEKGET